MTTNRKTTPAAAAAEPTLDDVKVDDTNTESAEETTAVPAVAESTPPLDSNTTVAAPADAPAAAPSDAAQEQDDPRKVTIRLAHPLDRDQDLQYLGLPPKEGGYKVHDEIRVSRSAAQSIINAGYAQVDPENKKAVAAVLNPGA